MSAKQIVSWGLHKKKRLPLRLFVGLLLYPYIKSLRITKNVHNISCERRDCRNFVRFLDANSFFFCLLRQEPAPPFAEDLGMEYLTLLRLIQKNKNCLRDYPTLLDNIFSHPGNEEELRRYLKSEEIFFFAEICDEPSLVREERQTLLDLQQQEVQFTFIGSESYPASFFAMPGAPLVLSYIGHPSWMRGACLSVVGSRDASPLSQQWMEEYFAEFLQQEKPVVVSGGARGVDQMAHQLALRNQCPTVVVLPSGLGCLYPANLCAWKKKIIEGGGCLASMLFMKKCANTSSMTAIV